MPKSKKLYAYVDESGKESRGKFFVVSVVMLKENQDLILSRLKQYEKISRKGSFKWSKAHHKYAKQYIEFIVNDRLFEGAFFSNATCKNVNYLDFTAIVTAVAVRDKIKSRQDKYAVNIYLDGFTRTDLKNFTQSIKPFGIKRKKIRGVRTEKNNAFIRLADAICGLVRQAERGNQWAEEILDKMQKRRMITRESDLPYKKSDRSHSF